MDTCGKLLIKKPIKSWLSKKYSMPFSTPPTPKEPTGKSSFCMNSPTQISSSCTMSSEHKTTRIFISCSNLCRPTCTTLSVKRSSKTPITGTFSTSSWKVSSSCTQQKWSTEIWNRQIYYSTAIVIWEYAISVWREAWPMIKMTIKMWCLLNRWQPDGTERLKYCWDPIFMIRAQISGQLAASWRKWWLVNLYFKEIQLSISCKKF